MTSQPTYRHGEPSVYQDPAELAKATRALRASGRRIALVPTMGALHAGHQELIRRARRIPGAVVAVSIFVNPLQFGPNEDLAAYPRPFDADLDVCARAGVELVFHPDVADLYPDGGVRVSLDPGPLGRELEGAVRPGHFAGVLTVVAKLCNIVRPDYAFFGEKDYQQLILIRRMVADLNLDVSVVGVPTVREDGGLALSSRNRYLDAEGREAALTLSAALSAGVYAGADGPAAVRAAAASVFAQRPDIAVDYLELRGDDLGPVPPTGPARLLVAARVGTTRLIDNAPVLLARQETGQSEKGQ